MRCHTGAAARLNGTLIGTQVLNPADQAFPNSRGGDIGLWYISAFRAAGRQDRRPDRMLLPDLARLYSPHDESKPPRRWIRISRRQSRAAFWQVSPESGVTNRLPRLT